MKPEIEAFLKRVRLTPEERENIRQEWSDSPLPHKFENLIELSAQAQLNKVLNDPDLALIDRERELPKLVSLTGEASMKEKSAYIWGVKETQEQMHKAGFTHSVIPLKEALKEE